MRYTSDRILLVPIMDKEFYLRENIYEKGVTDRKIVCMPCHQEASERQ